MSKSSVDILQKLFWENDYRNQLIGASLGAFLGFLLLLSAEQFYFDINSMLHNEEADGGHFIQLNKTVNIFNTIGGVSAFSQKEIEEIRELSSVETIGDFKSNNFKAGAYSDMLGFYTELFFEAVPEDFLDIDEPDFRWSEGRKEIPVIVARDYLALYNFGFAPSQGLPQISEKSASRLVMDVRLEGNGKMQTFKGRIVGFTDRINSILVPEAFMDWANREFGNGTKAPSKIILKVTNPLDGNFQAFIEEKGYEISTGRLLGEEYMIVFDLIVSVVISFGLIILLLATTVFVLGFQLVISKNAHSISMLLEQGYAPKVIAKLLETKFLKIFISIVFLAFAFLFLLHYLFVIKMDSFGFNLSINLHFLVYLCAISAMILLSWYNISRIRNTVNKMA